MPIVQRRPHVVELLNIAVDQRKKLDESRLELLQRPASIWFAKTNKITNPSTISSNNNSAKYHDDNSGTFDDLIAQKNLWHSLNHLNFNKDTMIYKFLVYYSRFCEKIIVHRTYKWMKTVLWPIAFAILVYQAPQANLGVNNSTDYGFQVLDDIVIFIFLLDSILRLSGVFIRINIEKAFNREVNPYSVFRQSGFVDIIVTILNISFGFTSIIGIWLRLLRLILITSTVLDLFPHIDVLMSSISNGFRSTTFTIVMLFLLVLSYGSIGYYFFRENDPFHFGGYFLSCLTFFQCSTLENWSTYYYVNYFGCDSFQSDYQYTPPPGVNVTEPVKTVFGDFYLPNCSSPRRQPIAATLIFVSYEVIAGYVIISMCLAAVASGINERLDQLRTLSLYGTDDEENEQQATNIGNQLSIKLHGKLNKENIGKASKLTGGDNEKKVLEKMLKRIWDGNHTLMKSTPENLSFRKSLSIKTLATDVEFIIKNNYYMVLFSFVILADVLLQMTEEQRKSDNDSHINNAHLVFQIFLTIDLLLKFIQYSNKFNEFSVDKWNLFDTVSTVLLFLPAVYPAYPPFDILKYFRIFRVFRTLNVCRNYISDLGIIMGAISSSILSVMYVLILVVIFFLYYALAGVLLFKDVDPFYFQNITAALKTLLQVMTLDNWSEVMRNSVFGCRLFGYTTGYPNFDELCPATNIHLGAGWWAPIYFVSFIIVSAMVLNSLLVGVIITSMELLREGYDEEKGMLKKVRVIQNRYSISQNAVDLLLQLFEKLDKDSKSNLSFEQLKPLMDLVNMPENDQFAFYVLVDGDHSGQIDFGEFCEMIFLMGLTHNKVTDQSNPPSKRDSQRSGTINQLSKFLSNKRLNVDSDHTTSSKFLSPMKRATSDIFLGITGSIRKSLRIKSPLNASINSNGSKNEKIRNNLYSNKVAPVITVATDNVEGVKSLDFTERKFMLLESAHQSPSEPLNQINLPDIVTDHHRRTMRKTSICYLNNDVYEALDEVPITPADSNLNEVASLVTNSRKLSNYFLKNHENLMDSSVIHPTPPITDSSVSFPGYANAFGNDEKQQGYLQSNLANIAKEIRANLTLQEDKTKRFSIEEIL